MSFRQYYMNKSQEDCHTCCHSRPDYPREGKLLEEQGIPPDARLYLSVSGNSCHQYNVTMLKVTM